MTSGADEKSSEVLIDFSEKEDDFENKEIFFEDFQFTKPELHAQISTESAVSELSLPSPGVETKSYSRLCGYLNKLGNNKILKTFRRRWFVFSENNCKLYYYRSSEDKEPLGEIDISTATFSFDVTNKERTGLFTISVPGRDYFLEANNRQTCLFWLQELQKYRRANSAIRTKNIGEQSTSLNDICGRPRSGLLAKIFPDYDTENVEQHNVVPLLHPVDCPKDVIGDESAASNSSAFLNAHPKLNIFYNQVKSASFVKYDKSPSECN